MNTFLKTLAFLLLFPTVLFADIPPYVYKETDGDPKQSLKQLAFPNGTLSCSGNTCTYTPAGGSGSPPFADTNSIVEGSADDTKEIRFEVDGLTTGTVRVITPPDSNTTLPIASQVITWGGPTSSRTYTLPDANKTFTGTGTLTNGRVCLYDSGGVVIACDTSAAGIDSDAIHDNVASEISAITSKATPVDGDFLVIEDSAAANAKKSITVSALETAVEAFIDTLVNLTSAANLATVGTITSGIWNAGAVTASAKITANASLDIKNGATSSGILSIFEDSDAGTNKATFQVPSLAADTAYTLPADDGDADEVLSTNGSGVLDWVVAGAGSGDITSVGSACSSGACDSISIADGQKIDLSGVTVNSATEGLLLPTFNSGGTETGQCSYDGTNDLLYCGNGTNAAIVNAFPMASSGLGTSATRYTGINSNLVSATETDVNNFRTHRSYIAQNLHCTIDSDPGGVGRSWDVTLSDDAGGSTLTCNIPNGSTECNDTTHRPTIAADSKLAVSWVRNSTANSPGNMVCSFELVPN